MSLNPEDFYKVFSDREIKKVSLQSMGDSDDKDIYIRSLSYAEKKRFQNGLEKIALKIRKLVEDKKTEFNDEVWKDDVKNADDYILPASMCDASGILMWKGKNADYKKFCEMVPPEVIEEIMYQIVEFNNLTGSFVPEDGSGDEKKNVEK